MESQRGAGEGVEDARPSTTRELRLGRVIWPAGRDNWSSKICRGPLEPTSLRHPRPTDELAGAATSSNGGPDLTVHRREQSPQTRLGDAAGVQEGGQQRFPRRARPQVLQRVGARRLQLHRRPPS